MELQEEVVTQQDFSSSHEDLKIGIPDEGYFAAYG